MLRFRLIFLVFIFLGLTESIAQELYPLNEPASTLPKNVLGIRYFSESYKEADLLRHSSLIRMMYGINSKLSMMVTLSASNHHGKTLPTNLITHLHQGSNSITKTNDALRGQAYTYKLNGANLYAKYRFLSIDDQNKHLRFACYGEYALNKAAHDEAEPNLMEDNGGFGAGIITTWLFHKFATSFTFGFIKPKSYQENIYNAITLKNMHTIINYGDAIRYNLSLGYLLYPKKYENYQQKNLNIYIEFMGKSYQQASVIQDGETINISSNALQKGSYLDIRPGIQAIFNSNLRVDFALGFPLINRSYVNLYPSYFIAIQRYFYL
jgi:hypothetical protein